MNKFAGKALLSGVIALVGLGLASGTAQAFNPQPDPPGRQAAVVVNQPFGVANKPGTVSVNPQQSLPQIAAHVAS